MVKIGFICAIQTWEKLKEIEVQLQKLCDIKIFTYNNLEEVKEIYISNCFLFDGILFGGQLAHLALTKEVESLPVPTDYIEIVDRDLYKLLLHEVANDRNLQTSRIAIDFLFNSNQYLDLHLVLEPKLFPYTPEEAKNNEFLTYEVIQDFHITLWEQGKIDLSITRYSNLEPKLKEYGIKVIHLYPSHETIFEKFTKMINEIEISQLADNQVVIGNISIHKLKISAEFTEESDIKLMQLHKALLEYSSQHKLILMIQKRQIYFEIITSVRDLKEKITNHYTNCSLFAFLSNHLPFNVNIGWGSGNTLHKARKNAQIANKHAEINPANGSYVITKNEEIIGPLGTDTCIQLSNSPNEQIEKWSNQLGISFLQIQKILAVIEQTNSNELSSQDIADYLGITIRSANRFLNILEEKGVAQVSFKKQEKLRGRPKKIYKIDFTSI